MIFILLLIHLSESCTITEYRTPCSPSGLFTLIKTGTLDCPESYPQSFPSLSCNFECQPGFYSTLNSNKQFCSPCPAGTFSVSGVQYGAGGTSWEQSILDTRSENWFLGEEDQTFTGLPGWQALNDMLESIYRDEEGHFWNLIYFSVNIVKRGELGIRYQKDTDVLGGVKTGTFKVIVDREVVIEDKEIDHGAWKLFEYDLQVGLHEIILEYNGLATPDMKKPKARVSSMYISGTVFADRSCYRCPAGGYLEAATSCGNCNYNEYWNQATCVKCPEGTYSFRGSVSIEDCIDGPSCAEQDYYYVDSICIDEKFDRVYKWKEPKICNSNKNDSSPLPAPTKGLPCKTCDPGSSWSEDERGSKYCSQCKYGTYLSEQMENCSICPAGTYSESEFEVKTFNTLPKGFSTFCILPNGEYCRDSNGWTLTGLSISTGSNHSSNQELVLRQTVTILANYGSIRIDVNITNSDSSGLYVFVDGSLVQLINSTAVVNFEVNQGEFVVDYVAKVKKGSNVRVEIGYLKIVGSNAGGAVRCSKCGTGTVSFEAMGACILCPSGKTSDDLNLKCVNCPYGFISDRPGSACKECPRGTVGDLFGQKCVAKAFIGMSDTKYLEYYVEYITGTEDNSICKMPTSKLYCIGNFYGPLPGAGQDFYISILNPGFLSIPNTAYYSQNDSSYSYMLVKSKEPEAVDSCSDNKILFNLGKEISEIVEVPGGFSFEYLNGDHCSEGLKYSTNISILCDMKTGIGWPSFTQMKSCKAYFVWKSKYGCPVCIFSNMKTTISECKDGVRFYKKVAQNDCILPFEYDIEWTESCDEVKELIYSWQIALGFACLGVLIVAGIVSGIVYIKYKRGYDRLSEVPDNKF